MRRYKRKDINKLYCPMCKKEVDFITKEKEVTYFVDGVDITFKEIQVRCIDCNENLYDSNIEKKNQKRFENELIKKGVIWR